MADGVSDRPPLADAAEREIIVADLDENIAVEAAAGSGKTTCLVGRLLSLARRGDIAPGRLLAAVTFTRKAAAELRDRWRHAIDREAAAASGTERDNLLLAAGSIRLCHIGTIHAFAARLLRERPVEAGVDLDFREIDEDEDAIFRNRAWDGFAARVHAGAHPEISNRLRRFGLDLEALRASFLDFTGYPDIAEWPGADAPADLPGWESFYAALREFGLGLEEMVSGEVEEAGEEELFRLYRALHAWAVRQSGPSLPALARMADLLEESPKACIKTWKGVFGQDCKARMPEEEARYARFFAGHIGPFLRRLRTARYRVVLECLLAARKMYDETRAAAGVLNFQDLLMRTAALLRDHPGVRADLARRYPRILVDEVQDTDPIQAEILFLLAGASEEGDADWRRARLRPGALFMVGDPKQSIYRFTRADVATYMEVKKLLAKNGGRVVRLGVNFRSEPKIIDWVNRTFEPKDGVQGAGRFPPEDIRHCPAYAPLLAGRSAATEETFSGVFRLDALPRVSSRNKAGAPPRSLADVLRDEAARIARFVRRAIDVPLLLPGRDLGPRPARADDFLILTRTKSGVAVIADRLRLAGIPVRVSGKNSFEPDSALRLLLLAVKAALNPDDPVLRVAVLRSRLFGVSDRELYAWKRRGLSFSGTETGVPSGMDPIADAFARLAGYRECFRKVDPAAALRFIADDLGILLLAARDAGSAGMGAVKTVLDRLALGARDLRTPFALADALEKSLDSGDFDVLPPEGPGAPAVRVMNLHKAKGLEAPVVFLAGSPDLPNHPVRVCIDRSGEKARGFLALLRGKDMLACPREWAEMAADEMRFLEYEELRLRYVAATRAGSAAIATVHPASGGKSAFLAEILVDDPLPEKTDCAEPPKASPALVGRVEAEEAISAIARRVEAVLVPSYRVVRAKEGGARTEKASGGTSGAIPDGEEPGWTGVRLAAEEAAALGEVAHALLADGLYADKAALSVKSAELLRLAGLPESLLDDLTGMVLLAGSSEIQRRADGANRMFRELPFVMAREAEDGRRETVRGVIDLAFEEDDGWVVVDYKSDRLGKSDAKAAAERHRGQVETYADAIRRMFAGARVKEAGVLFLRNGRYVRFG